MTNIENVQDSLVHHAANAAAVTIPTISMALHGPELLTYVTATLGVIWYCILIGEKIIGWAKKFLQSKKP